MKLYFRNPGSSTDFIIDGAVYGLNCNLSNEINDGLSFETAIDHIQMGARILATADDGEVLFVGPVAEITYSASGGMRRYDCIAAEALLRYVHAPEIIYPGGVGLTLSDVFSSDAPPQGAGPTQYLMPLLWLSRSKIGVGTDTGIVSWDSDGVGTLEGWGPSVSGHSIYYGGHLLTASTLSAITGGTYRYAISGGNLYIRGAGTGDVYDVIAADGWKENWVRLGTVASDDTLDSAYDVGEEEILDLVRDLVTETGQYIVFRRTEDYVYLDVAAVPKASGSEASPVASLHSVYDFSVRKIKAPRNPPVSCVIGLGADYDVVEGARWGAGELPSVGRAWTEETYELAKAKLAPWGNLAGATQDVYDEMNQHAPVLVDLYRSDLRVGDWCSLDLGYGDKFAAQLRTLSMQSAGSNEAVFGSPDMSALTAFLNRAETDAIEAYREGLEAAAAIGDAYRYGLFGATESISGTFVSIDFAGADVPILLSLEAYDPTEITEYSGAVSLNIDINGDIVRLPWRPWSAYPITEFDIAEWCLLDGSENTIEVSLEAPTGWVPSDYMFELFVTGLGADSDPAPAHLDVDNATLSDDADGTYFTTGSTSPVVYVYAVDDLDAPLSRSMTVTAYARVKGSNYWSELRGLWVYGYGRTAIVVDGSYYYGTWGNHPTFTNRSTVYTTNPKTGLDWTFEEINGISAGGSLYVNVEGGEAFISEAWVTVTP